MSAAGGSSVAVVVVNYGTADLACEAVDSVLARDHGGHRVEIHLVDNASPGGDADRLRAAHGARGWGDRVRLWVETENHGFGRGNNLVIHDLARRPAPPDHVFLLNPDARLENEAIAILADRLDRAPQAGAAGASIHTPSGQPVTAAFRFPSVLGEFVQAVNFGPLARLFARRQVSLPPDHPGGTVDWVSGAAVMMRLAHIAPLDGFDPDFFLYFEEVELMFRLGRAGHEVLYVPEARVVHVEGAATQVKGAAQAGKAAPPRRKARPAYWYRSWRLYHAKTRGRAGAIMAGLGWMAGAAINLPLARLRGQPAYAPEGFFRDFPRLVLLPLIRGKAG